MYYMRFIMKKRECAKQIEECPVQKILIEPLGRILTLKVCDSHMHWRLNKTKVLASRTAELKRL